MTLAPSRGRVPGIEGYVVLPVKYPSMLTKIREKTQGIIAGFIVALIAIPFALWGISSYFDGGSAVNVAKVDDIELSRMAYRRALDQFRSQVKPSVLDSYEFKERVLNGLINQALLVRDAEEQGYRLSDAKLGRLIREAPYFQRNGRFDPQLYEALLRQEGININDFETRVRRENLIKQAQSGFNESVIVTDADIAPILRLLQQQREIAYVVISPKQFINRISVGEDAIKEYYSTHTDAFKIPEQVRIEYIRLSAEESIKKYQPSEDELRMAYDEEAGSYAIPEKRRASHILIQLANNAPADVAQRALDKIRDVESKLRQGANFSTLAKKYSNDPDSAAKGGDLGTISRGILPRELEAAIFRLKLGEISEPVRSDFGYHLAKLTGYIPEKRKTFAQMRGELVKLVRKRKGEERFYEQIDQFQNLVYEQLDSLTPAAKELGLKIQQSEWFTRTGGKGIAAEPKIVAAAFDPEVLEQKRNSDAIEINSGTLMALRIIGRRPATVRPLSEVRARIERTLKRQQAREKAQELSAKISQRLQEGAKLKLLAKEHKLELWTPGPLKREQTKGVDRRIVDAAFRAQRPRSGEAVHGVVDLGNKGDAVFALKRVWDGKPEQANAALREKVRRQLRARRGANYYANYRAGLRKKADIEIYTDKL